MKAKIETRQLVESGILLALGFILSVVKLNVVPNGGSVTLVSMLPLVVLGYKYGPAWGMLCGLLHGLLQILQDGGFAPPTKDFSSYMMVFLLDYILAWAAVGLLAGLLRNVSSKTQACIAVGSFVGIAGRFLCSFLSGVVIWGVYAPEGQNVFAYSFLYNSTYMIPEMIATTIAGFALFSMPVLQKQIRFANTGQSA